MDKLYLQQCTHRPSPTPVISQIHSSRVDQQPILPLAHSEKSLLALLFVPCVCVCLFSFLSCSAWLNIDSSSVSVWWAGPDTFTLPFLLSTLSVKDLPSHKATLLETRKDCAHSAICKEIHTQKLYAHILFGIKRDLEQPLVKLPSILNTYKCLFTLT